MTIKSSTTFLLRLGVLALCLLAPQLAAAQDPPKPADPAPDPDKVTLNFFKDTEVGGLVDGYYLYNSNKVNPSFHAFDVTHNSFTLSMAEVWLAKSPSADSPIGYKIRMNFGQAAGIMSTGNDQYVEEAYGSYLAPVGKGLQIDFGKFVTTAGAEVIEAKDDWNYTRGLLFQLAIPLWHAGLRLTYSPTDKVTLIGGVVNGWNNLTDNNTGKTVLGTIIVKPNSKVSISENYIGGPEQAADNSDWRSISDTVLSYTATDMVSVLLNYDYGRDTVAGAVNQWQGLAGSVKIQANKFAAVIPRVEYFNDKNGWSTGTPQNLTSATVTLELKPKDNFMWRLEYRGDFSDTATFTDDAGAAKKNQQSIVFGFLYNFSSKM
jgi:hypothetical protein